MRRALGAMIASLSFCGATNPTQASPMIAAASSSSAPASIFDFSVDNGNVNYEELNDLYLEYKERGVQIMAFPCNKFGGQEPGSNEEIQRFIKERNVSFPVFGKLDCSGSAESSPLFQFLTKQLDGGAFRAVVGDGLKWNFHKFLCDSNGVPVKRYGPTTNPLSIIPDIEKLLEEGDKTDVPKEEL